MKKTVYLFTLLFCLARVSAQSNFSLKVSGEVITPLKLSLSDLAELPHTTAVLNDKDGKSHTYSGVSVADVLIKAGVTMGKNLHGENLSKYLLVKCADGYQVLFSLAELDNNFTDRKVILADKIEGNLLQESKGPLRIVVEGEKKPARSSFQVVELFVGYGKD